MAPRFGVTNRRWILLLLESDTCFHSVWVPRSRLLFSSSSGGPARETCLNWFHGGRGGRCMCAPPSRSFSRKNVLLDVLRSLSPGAALPPAGRVFPAHTLQLSSSLSPPPPPPQGLVVRVRSVSVGEQWLQQQSAPCRSVTCCFIRNGQITLLLCLKVTYCLLTNVHLVLL